MHRNYCTVQYFDDKNSTQKEGDNAGSTSITGVKAADYLGGSLDVSYYYKGHGGRSEAFARVRQGRESAGYQRANDFFVSRSTIRGTWKWIVDRSTASSDDTEAYS